MLRFAFVSAWLYAGHSCELPQDVRSSPATAREATKMIAFFIFCSSNFRDAKLAICFYVGYLFDVKKYYLHLPFTSRAYYYVAADILLQPLQAVAPSLHETKHAPSGLGGSRGRRLRSHHSYVAAAEARLLFLRHRPARRQQQAGGKSHSQDRYAFLFHYASDCYGQPSLLDERHPVCLALLAHLLRPY